ncbi:LysR family transcriptional regulator [Vibrio sonorensis]|uniref:LysR family transcriptional regulator n=1 Tax=Vibrio sonorensis TaxID=1004316 RepID=UPI0008DA8F86|nr:LysR family transcriptional regulator [Vibrio sonorensis]
MDVKQLTHFVQVAEDKNFTLAAKKLHIAQPALSISIRKFEQQLGLKLFKRDDRRIELTGEGEVLLVHAYKVLQQVEDAKLAMDELRGLEKGEVRLGAPSMLGSYFFPEILMAFKSRYPNLKLTLVDAGTRSIREMLLQGELDIGVVVNDDISDDLETDPLINAEMVAVVGKTHPLAGQKSLSFESFFSNELVMFKPGYFHREYIESMAQQVRREMNCSFETNLLPMILNIVKNEYAITALLELVTQHEQDVVAVSFEEPVNIELSLAWRKGGYLSLADRAFLDFVKEHTESSKLA